MFFWFATASQGAGDGAPVVTFRTPLNIMVKDAWPGKKDHLFAEFYLDSGSAKEPLSLRKQAVLFTCSGWETFRISGVGIWKDGQRLSHPEDVLIDPSNESGTDHTFTYREELVASEGQLVRLEIRGDIPTYAKEGTRITVGLPPDVPISILGITTREELRSIALSPEGQITIIDLFKRTPTRHPDDTYCGQ